MKRFILAMVIIVFISSSAAAKKNIGKIINIIGYVDITSLSTGKKFTPDLGTIIQRDYRIRTGKRSFVEIVLNNGTKIFIKEISVINIPNLKMKSSHSPTRIKMLTGKIRLILKKTYKRRTLILKTPTMIAGVRGTDFGVITSRTETKLVVFKGSVEAANIKKDIIKSYILKEREEVSIKENRPPSRPRIVPVEILKSWFEYYTVDKQNRIIIKRGKDRGFIDKLLRKKEF